MPAKRKNIDLDFDSSKGDIDIDKSKKYLDIDVDEKAITHSKGKGRPKGAKTVNKRKANAWIELIKKVKVDNPGMSHKDAMKAASVIKKHHGSSAEAMGSGASFKDILKHIGSLGERALKTGSDIVKSKEFKEGAKDVAKAAFTKARPHLEEAGKEAVSRVGKKITGSRSSAEKSFGDIAKSGAKDVGKELAHQGIDKASEQLAQRIPKEAHHMLAKVSHEVHKKIDQRIGSGMVGKYIKHCDDCAEKGKEKHGGFAFASILAALAPAVIPMAADLLQGVLGTILGKGMIGKGTPGDYTFNELGVRSGQAGRGHERVGVDGAGTRGGSLLETQKSDPPLDNIFAKHSNLWQFTPVPGFMGITEVPTNQFFTPTGGDENLGIWEMANDIDEYINSAPTVEDGITSIAPTTMTINPTAISTMPADSTIGSTVKEITGEAKGQGLGGNSGGFVYAPGISLSRLANFQTRFGSGIVGPMSIHAAGAGDVTRVGHGVLPIESVVTGQPIGISERGRGMKGKQQGGSSTSALIKGSDVATWK